MPDPPSLRRAAECVDCPCIKWATPRTLGIGDRYGDPFSSGFAIVRRVLINDISRTDDSPAFSERTQTSGGRDPSLTVLAIDNTYVLFMTSYPSGTLLTKHRECLREKTQGWNPLTGCRNRPALVQRAPPPRRSAAGGTASIRGDHGSVAAMDPRHPAVLPVRKAVCR